MGIHHPQQLYRLVVICTCADILRCFSLGGCRSRDPFGASAMTSSMKVLCWSYITLIAYDYSNG